MPYIVVGMSGGVDSSVAAALLVEAGCKVVGITLRTAPWAEPEDAAYVLERTKGVVGFFGASSMERLPTEVAMTETMRRFKSIEVKGEARAGG